MTRKRAFIVEDESIVRLHLETLLAELGWDVAGSAASSAEALRDLAQPESRPDVVLMDVRIPGPLDGIELARDLRDSYGLHSVFVTAYADDDTIRRVQDVGGLGYLVKPFTRAEVGAVLATALGQSRIVTRLRDRSRPLESALENAGDAVLVLDEAGRVVGLNERAARLTGWSRDEARDRPADEVLRFEGGAAAAEVDVRSALDRASDPGVTSMRLLSRDGTAQDVELDVAPLRDLAGVESGRLVVLRVAAARLPAKAPRRPAGAWLHTVREGAPRFHDLVGQSLPMRRIFDQIRELAPVDWTVLVEGETGSGKELVARALHAASPRRRGPFVAVNCAGLTDSLLASQLFGHRKGSFTGAVRDQPGLFETADGGTLFLDEIGDVSENVQKTLLRALEEKHITPLGDTRPHEVDVRLVAASQRDLSDEVRRGRFRADLLFRLRVARISLPPLRDRREDIPLLAEWFLGHSRKAAGKSVHAIGPEALQRLVAYPWPGNVRELRSAVDYAVLACRGETIRAEDLPPEVATNAPTVDCVHPGATGDDPASKLPDRQSLLEALERAGGNRTRAARLAGVSRATLYRRLSELGVQAHPENSTPENDPPPVPGATP